MKLALQQRSKALTRLRSWTRLAAITFWQDEYCACWFNRFDACCNISLAPVYAWSRRGERAFASVPRNWGKNVTLLASMSVEGMGPCLAVEGSTTREVFEAYL